MKQLHFTIEPDAFFTLGYTKYWLYSYVTLKDNGFIWNTNGTPVFTFCPFCKKYHWTLPMNRMDMSNSVYVCDSCQTHASAYGIRLFN